MTLVRQWAQGSGRALAWLTLAAILAAQASLHTNEDLWSMASHLNLKAHAGTHEGTYRCALSSITLSRRHRILQFRKSGIHQPAGAAGADVAAGEWPSVTTLTYVWMPEAATEPALATVEGNTLFGELCSAAASVCACAVA